MIKKIQKLGGSMLVLLSLYSAPAQARCDGCVVAAIAATRTVMVLQAERIIGAISGSAATVASQTARSAEMMVQGNQRTEAAMETNRQDDRYQVTDACAVLASTRGTSEAGRAAPGLGGGVGRGGSGGRSPSGVSGDMQRALNIASGAAPAPSPEAQAALASSGACSSFVSTASNRVRAEACTMAGYSASASSGFPDGDIRAETLFDGPQRGATAEQFRRRLTVDPDGAEASAMNAYLRNLNTPIDLSQLRAGELRTDMGRQYMAYRDSYEARMSMAEKPARNMVANRYANRALLPVVEQLLASGSTGPFVRSYLDQHYPRWQSRGISLDELTNLEVERRYMNRNWHILMASAPPEAHIKEQTTMLAFQSVLLQRISAKLDEQSVLAGQNAATLVRQEMTPQLIQLHAAASK